MDLDRSPNIKYLKTNDRWTTMSKKGNNQILIQQAKPGSLTSLHSHK